MDIGTACCITIIGLALGLSNANFPNWWGNTVSFTNLDANGILGITPGPVTKVLPSDGSFFGPKHWF